IVVELQTIAVPVISDETSRIRQPSGRYLGRGKELLGEIVTHARSAVYASHIVAEQNAGKNLAARKSSRLKTVRSNVDLARIVPFTLDRQIALASCDDRGKVADTGIRSNIQAQVPIKICQRTIANRNVDRRKSSADSGIVKAG